MYQRLSVDAAKSFNILATVWTLYIITLIVHQTKLFSELYLNEFLDTKPLHKIILSCSFSLIHILLKHIWRNIFHEYR